MAVNNCLSFLSNSCLLTTCDKQDIKYIDMRGSDSNYQVTQDIKLHDTSIELLYSVVIKSRLVIVNQSNMLMINCNYILSLFGYL